MTNQIASTIATSYVDEKAEPGSVSNYKVIAVDQSGESGHRRAHAESERKGARQEVGDESFFFPLSSNNSTFLKNGYANRPTHLI